MEDVKYAGFWIRLGAVLIDLMVMGVVLYIPSTVIYGSEYWVGDQFFYGFWDLMFSYVLPLVGTIWFWLRFSGTPGKMVLKLKIVDAGTGNKLTFGQAIGRYFAYILSAIPFFLGYIWVGFDKRKQSWHDKLAGTVVIRNVKNDVGNSE
tara:strand:+ start:208 stop:654 length:447 start_codon:yes stop_codon:yes gene_type:complete